MISKQILTITAILERCNKHGYKVYMPTYQSYYKSHPTIYKDVDYKDIDKRDHGWVDICTKSLDGDYKYYKFIALNETKLYKGWLKKWSKIEGNNHFVVIFTEDNKYSIYTFQDFQNHFNKYTSEFLNNKEWTVLSNFYDKQFLSVDPTRMLTKRSRDVKQCFDYAIDNPWEYLTHKSAGFCYIYNNYTYYSLSDVYENTIYGVKYNKFEGFKAAFRRNKIVDVQKLPVSYLDEVESNNDAKEVSFYAIATKAPQPTNVVYSESREQELSGCPKAKSSLPVLDMKQKESVNHKSKEQETKPENEPKAYSIWREESVGSQSDFDYLRVLIEEENKNKVITPVQVYKCKRA